MRITSNSTIQHQTRFRYEVRPGSASVQSDLSELLTDVLKRDIEISEALR